MMQVVFTYEDIEKLRKAYDNLDFILEQIEKMNQERDTNHKPSKCLQDAHRYLHEVLYGH